MSDNLFMENAYSIPAFTARSIAGLIGGVGLLTKSGLPYLPEVFKDFENRWNPNYRPASPNIPFPKKPSVNDPSYRDELEKVLRFIGESLVQIIIDFHSVSFLEPV